MAQSPWSIRTAAWIGTWPCSPRGLPGLFGKNGLLGFIDGKTYQGAMMTPAATFGITRDDRIGEVLSFVRYAWGNEASSVTKDEVAKFRNDHKKRLRHGPMKS